MIKFVNKKHQKIALIICVLPVFAGITAHLTQNYRFSENLRYIYLIGVITVYLSWGISLVWSLVNSTEIFFSTNNKKSFKIIWGIVSLLPIIYLISMLLISMFFDPQGMM